MVTARRGSRHLRLRGCGLLACLAGCATGNGLRIGAEPAARVVARFLEGGP